jgi:hypothetical protein
VTGRGEFGYAQARIQAHYGQRPTDAVWRQMSATKDLAAYLATARGTVLAARVANLSSASDVHDIEHSMRGQFHTLTREVAHWVPAAWRPPVAWTAWLPYLPLLRYLLDGEEILQWMRDGRRSRRFLAETTAARAHTITELGGGPLVDAAHGRQSLLEAWLAEWQQRWPGDAPAAAGLNQLTATLRAHARRFMTLAPGDTGDARHALNGRLQILFRRQAQQPAVVFIYLALFALDLERLREGLIRRALFAASEHAA